MSDLVDWLLGQLDMEARENWHDRNCTQIGPLGFPCDCRVPLRHAADIAAKRRIVELYQRALETTGCGLVGLDGGVFLALDEVVHLLAAALSDRPGYDPAWAPREES